MYRFRRRHTTRMIPISTARATISFLYFSPGEDDAHKTRGERDGVRLRSSRGVSECNSSAYCPGNIVHSCKMRFRTLPHPLFLHPLR